MTEIWHSAILKEDLEIFDNIIKKEEDAFTPSYAFSNTGKGWFETHLGCSASQFVTRLRKMRRENKTVKDDIDLLIDDVRLLKALEVKITLNEISWCNGKEMTIKQLGVSDTDLQNLRRFGEIRKVGLVQACNLWEGADSSLKMLDEFSDVWGEEETLAWASAMRNKTDAKKMWKNSLHQSGKLTQKEQDTLQKTSTILEKHGAMSSRRLQERMMDGDVIHKSMTPAKLGKLLSMYGEEYDIISGATKGTFVKMNDYGIIIKNPWSYAANFLESDGNINVSERGEASVVFSSLGSRGKAHCEEIYKSVGCGSLQLNLKINKNNFGHRHRLQFNSIDDIKMLLNKMLPFLTTKKTQVETVLEYLDTNDMEKMENLKRVILRENNKSVGEMNG